MVANNLAGSFTGTDVLVGNGVLTATEISGLYIGFLGLPTISRTAVVASSAEVSTSLVVPLGAVVTRAVVRVGANAPGTTTIGGIASVRASAGEPDATTSELVVDFATLRTVSALAAPTGVNISKITPWLGTKFDGAVTLSPSSANAVTFTELQTERLLVDLAVNVSPAAMGSDGLVTTTTPPADLELAVAGGRVWFRVGPAPAGFTTDVDVTAAVQAAVGGATLGDPDGNVAVPIVLTARVPGDLDLSLPEDPRFLRTHAVAFPGPTTPVPFSEEGVADVDLPLPSDAAGWTIHRVVATMSPRDPGPQRVLPPDGPPISVEADLLLDPDRRLVARLPRSSLAPFERLAGVRVLLTPQAGGIEIGGSLLTGSSDLPGEVMTDSTLTPLSLPAGPRAWVSLLLAQPVDLAKTSKPSPDDHLWIALAVTRGSARLALAGPGQGSGGSGGESSDDGAVLRRIVPNGLAKPLSIAYRPRVNPTDPSVPIAGDTAALRVIGIAPDAAPVQIVAADLPAADGSTGETMRQLGLDGSVAITLDPAGPRNPLTLRLVATAATAVTLGPVVVAYTDTGGSGT